MSTIYGIDENSELKSTGVQGTLVGEIKLMAADSAPASCLACDGSAVSRTTYAELFSVIGTTWGSGDGSTTFNLPDLRDEWLLFAGSSHPVGADVAAGLPEISGQIGGHSTFFFRIGDTRGAFNVGGDVANLTMERAASEDTQYSDAMFRASNSNPIYGASSTVQPQSRALAPYIVYAA